MAVNIVDIVNILEVHSLLKPTKRMNEWYQCKCPFHGGGNEKKPSFGISLENQYRGGASYPAGFAHCFACGYAADLEKFVGDLLQLHEINQTGVEWLTENVPGYESSSDFDYLIPESMMKTLDSKYGIECIQMMSQTKPEYVSDEELASYRYTVPYMYERKLTDEIIAKYDIGYDAKWIPPGRTKPVPCITFPVRDRDGHTLFFCRRSIQGKLYNYPTGVTKPVFGLDMVPYGTSSVVICESCINCLTAVAYGYPAVALLGTGNSYQIQQLKELGAHEFVICTDGDEAGRRAASKLKNHLSSVAMVWVINMPEGKDLNDLDKETFDRLYRERE